MGRYSKKGLDFFHLNACFYEDERIIELIKRQGGKALSVFVILLCNIYKQGYYIFCDKKLISNVAKQSGCEPAYVGEVIKSSLCVGLFHKTLFVKDSILTSIEIQENYSAIIKQYRRQAKLNEFSLLGSEENKTTDKQETLFEEDIKKIVIRVNEEDFFIPPLEEQNPFEPTKLSVATTLDEEIAEMKQSDIWLDNLQVLHNMDINKLREKLDEFKLQCIADGNTGHIKISEAKRHFNNWLRIVSNDKIRACSKAERRGNILKADEAKNYSDTF